MYSGVFEYAALVVGAECWFGDGERAGKEWKTISTFG